MKGEGGGIENMGVSDLDCMNGANGDPGDGHAGKDMTADLEGAHGQGGVEDWAGGGAESGETDEGGHEEGTVGGDEEELDKGEGDGVAEGVHDGLSGVGGECGGGIPDGTLADERERGHHRERVEGIKSLGGRWLYLLTCLISHQSPLRQEKWKMPNDTRPTPVK